MNKLKHFKDFNFLKPKEKIFLTIVFIDLCLLIFFGKSYTKFVVYGYLHLHDLILAIVFLSTFIFKNKPKLLLIEVLIVISVIYLLLALYKTRNIENNLYFVFRQYMIYGYILISYSIIRTIASFKKGLYICYQIIIFTGIITLLAQFIYIFYYVFFVNLNPIGRNGLSPIITYGIIVSSVTSLIYSKGIYKHILFSICLFFALTIGQDSVYLSLIFIYITFYFMKFKIKGKIITSISLFLIISLLFFIVPTFTDVNVLWRYTYWRATFENFMLSKDVFLGKGFGVTYLDETTRMTLNELMLSRGYNVIIDLKERYEITAHNSFITLIYHLGFLNILLIYPFRDAFKKKIIFDKINLSLLLILLGMSVWAAFNLILELPHTANVFWIIFFTLVFYIKKEK